MAEVAQHQIDDDLYEVEILLGDSLTLTVPFESQSKRVFKALAVAAEGTPNEGWQYAELSFDEDNNDLKKVSLEGSVQKGFEVTVEFHRPIYVQTLPG